jgi:hypothetical protein
MVRLAPRVALVPSDLLAPHPEHVPVPRLNPRSFLLSFGEITWEHLLTVEAITLKALVKIVSQCREQLPFSMPAAEVAAS